MDVLSDVLGAVRIAGSVLFLAEFTAPWSLSTPPTREFAPLFVPNARRMILFHIVAEGACQAECEGHPPLALAAGDILVMPYGDGAVMGDRAGVPAESALQLLPPLPWEKPPTIRYGGNGDLTRILCGFLHVEEVFLHPLLSQMPPLVRVRTGETYPRLKMIVNYALDEAAAGQPGGACLLTRLADIMFIEILRQYAEEQRAAEETPLAALKDPVVGRALALIHRNPEEKWTVERLAREAAASRSVLAARFTALIGMPPMQYLTRWRIQLAARRLKETHKSTAAIAAEIGYESEPAFNKAFRRHVGQPPASWRRQQAAATEV